MISSLVMSVVLPSRNSLVISRLPSLNWTLERPTSNARRSVTGRDSIIVFLDFRRVSSGVPCGSCVIGLGRMLASVVSFTIGAPTRTVSPTLQRISETAPSTGLVMSKTLLVASTEATRSPHSRVSPGSINISTTSTDSSAGPEPMA